jgi:hypothetical protein
VSHCTRTTSLAFASALARTATATDPAGSSSQTSFASSASPTQPPIVADTAPASPGDANATAKAENPMTLRLHEIEGKGVWGITTKWEF